MNNANRAKAKVASKCSEKDTVGKDINYGDKPHVALTSVQSIVDKSEPIPLAYSSMFPGKLYDLLANSETNGLAHIVSFQKHGLAFNVPRVLCTNRLYCKSKYIISATRWYPLRYLSDIHADRLQLVSRK
jgi:hypothetical protein